MFNNMEYVYEVFNEGSFSKAADKLFISQPSLSATVKKTEKRIGCQLFDRSTYPIQLTDCGREYIKAVERIMDIQNEFENYLNNLNELKVGNLSVGASNFFTSYVLPPILACFKHKHPGVTIHLVEANTTQLEMLLFNGTLDLIIDNYDFNQNTYKKCFLYKENLVLTVPLPLVGGEDFAKYRLTAEDIRNNHHLEISTPAVPLSLFKEFPYLFLRDGNDTRVRFEKICQAARINPNVILELDQLATAYNIVCQGMGITLVSDTLVKKVRQDESVAFFKLDNPCTCRDVHIYYKHSKYVTRPMEEFISIAASLK